MNVVIKLQSIADPTSCCVQIDWRSNRLKLEMNTVSQWSVKLPKLASISIGSSGLPEYRRSVRKCKNGWRMSPAIWRHLHYQVVWNGDWTLCLLDISPTTWTVRLQIAHFAHMTARIKSDDQIMNDAMHTAGRQMPTLHATKLLQLTNN